jgi:biotin-(acetyl-CoA carboxylase) ligase
VRIAQANGAYVQGRALGIDGSGQLRVETPDGIVRVLSADAVTLL